MEFIYTGRTEVSKNSLPTLMNIAQELGCSSLSKAIEKAIHSCGVEIFRKRVQIQAQSVALSKSVPPCVPAHAPSTVAFPNKAFMYQLNDGNNRPSHQEQIKEVTFATNNEPHDLTQSIDSIRQKDDESIDPNEIKIEPGENMMLELDPSSIAPTIGSTTSTNGNQSPSSAFSVPVTNEISTLQRSHVKNDNDLSNSAELETNEEGFQQEDIDSIIGMRDRITDKDIEEIPNVDILHNTSPHENADEDQFDDDEEMPITVVDLKSLAETGIEAEVDDEL